MSMITINKGGSIKYGNFTEKELFSKSPDAGNKHELDSNVIDGINIIRNFYGKPRKVTSSYRTLLHETTILLKPFPGYHYKKLAIDSAFSNETDHNLYHDDLVNQIRNHGPLFALLRKAGIRGFGVYDGFVHLDTRPEGSDTKHSDEFGKYAFWDETVKFSKDKFNFFQGYSMEDGTSGIDEKKKIVVRWLIFGTLLTLCFRWWVKRKNKNK